jgi:hypothetical protein
LEWVLGLKDEKPTEEEVHAVYVQEIENHPRPQKGMMRGLPMQERSVKTAWLGWILGIPDDEIKNHQNQYEVK